MKKNKEENNNLFIKLLLLLLLVAVIVIVIIVLPNFKKSENVTEETIVDEIKNFNYTVNENDTKLFKTTFDELKKILAEKNVDGEKYAETISKLFIIDFFSLDNKTSKNDIGGVQFVYSSYKASFVDYARDGIYKQVINNIDTNESQNLPLVDSVEVVSINKVSPSSIFNLEELANDTEEDAYEVTINWTYENSDDFQTSSVLTIVKDGDNLSIAKMTDR